MSSTILAYDFIVVGAGPSGCAVALRLAQAASKPQVLLVEAGGDNKDASYAIPAERFTLLGKEPTLNWGYKTEPQTHLKGQQIDYSRGRGLGGSTAINFCCWLIGADEDFNEWARIVGDDAWAWRNVKERMKKVESYHVAVPEEYKKYLNPKVEDHGTNGPLNLTYASTFEKGMSDVFVAAEEIGMSTNPDVNSGSCLGLGMGAGCMHKGVRTTASSYLANAPSNLTVMVNAPVASVVFSDKRAIGIKTIDGRGIHAKNDVILSGGALNSPQLLMLSGIGPADELQKHGIPVLHDLPEVGKNLQDHSFSGVTLIQKPGTNDRMAYETDPGAQAAAKAQYDKDKTGLLSTLYCSVPMGWFKSDAVLGSSEYRALDKYTQEHLQKSSIPSFEIATNTPPLVLGGYELKPTDSYLTGLAFVMNPQSSGEVTLTSADPSVAPKIQPNLVQHPYDRRVAIEALKRLMDLFEAPALKKSTVQMIGPRSRSDADVWDHICDNMFSSWHMCRTVRMGTDAGACTDTDFRVNGVQNLRVVDLSVIPILPNNHTQSTAYLVGETAAEKIIAQYGL